MPLERDHRFGYWHDPIFVMSLATYFINRELIKPNLHHYSSLFNGHLDDCLLVPVVLPLYLFFYRQLGLRPDDVPPRSWEVGLHVLVWIVFFKWFGPFVLHRGVADTIDDWCYLGGGVIAWLIWQYGTLFRNPRIR
jgi:hypothetical protein